MAKKFDAIKCDGERYQRLAPLFGAVENAVRSGRLFAQRVILEQQLVGPQA